MCRIGDIVRIHCPQTGYPKYHLCVKEDSADSAATFLFMNSEGGYEDDYEVACERVDCLKPSGSGTTVFACNCLVYISKRNRETFGAEVLGQIDSKLAEEIIVHVHKALSLTKPDRQCVISGLTSYCESSGASEPSA